MISESEMKRLCTLHLGQRLGIIQQPDESFKDFRRRVFYANQDDVIKRYPEVPRVEYDENLHG